MHEGIPTRKIITPLDKHEVVIKQFITGYDDEAIQGIYTAGKHKVAMPDPRDPDKQGQAMEFEGSVIQEADREEVKRVVVSVDGVTENVIDLVYRMRKADANFVKAEVNKIVYPEVTQEKK